jgi:hypothetical protein
MKQRYDIQEAANKALDNLSTILNLPADGMSIGQAGRVGKKIQTSMNNIMAVVSSVNR